MGIAQWMRVLDTVGGLVQMTGRLRRPPEHDPASTAGFPGTAGGPLGALETRLAGVVVAALKEAFDRDRARMDLERSHMEAERERAEAALRAELRRQAVERIVAQLRLVSVMAIGIWMLSAALGIWLPGMRTGLPRGLMAGGWLLAIATLGCAFAAWQSIASSSSAAADASLAVSGSGETVQPTGAASLPARAAPWLLLGSLALVGGSLLSAL
jgi:hypothetical protein